MNLDKTLAKAITAITGDVRQAVICCSPTFVVKATRRGKPDLGTLHTEILVTFGRPNYSERKFIKVCLAANESSPIRKPQLKFFK